MGWCWRIFCRRWEIADSRKSIGGGNGQFGIACIHAGFIGLDFRRVLQMRAAEMGHCKGRMSLLVFAMGAFPPHILFSYDAVPRDALSPARHGRKATVRDDGPRLFSGVLRGHQELLGLGLLDWGFPSQAGNRSHFSWRHPWRFFFFLLPCATFRPRQRRRWSRHIGDRPRRSFMQISSIRGRVPRRSRNLVATKASRNGSPLAPCAARCPLACALCRQFLNPRLLAGRDESLCRPAPRKQCRPDPQ